MLFANGIFSIYYIKKKGLNLKIKLWESMLKLEYEGCRLSRTKTHNMQYHFSDRATILIEL